MLNITKIYSKTIEKISKEKQDTDYHHNGHKKRRLQASIALQENGQGWRFTDGAMHWESKLAQREMLMLRSKLELDGKEIKGLGDF